MLPWPGFELTTLVVIGTDCTGSCKSNYHTITTTTAPTLKTSPKRAKLWNYKNSSKQEKTSKKIVLTPMLSLIFRLYVRVWNRYSYLVLSYITVDKLFNSTQNRSENFKDYAEVSGVKPLYTIFQLYHGMRWWWGPLCS
jgi:hypothetical protein